MIVNISDKGKDILRLCERKIQLQQEAELLNQKAHELILKLKELSDKQAVVLSYMQTVDESIERISGTI